MQILGRRVVTPPLPRPAILNHMTTQPPPTISSFVIRFVVNEPAAVDRELSTYHGSIRHVQSDEMLNFSVWQDAVEFIQRYVLLEIAPQTNQGVPSCE